MILLHELKDYIKVSEGSDDALLVLLEDRAVEFVEDLTGRYFGPPIAHTEYIDGNGTGTIWLAESPSSITSVRERYGAGDAWTAIVEGADDGFELRGSRLLRKDGTWAYGYEYEVVYTFGYTADASAEPGPIRQLVMDLVKLKYDERCSNLAVQSERLGAEQYVRNAFTADLHSIPWVRETVAAFRHPRVY